ncbi:hypothetical protein ALC57_00697 [Trachymyrmex cornetzi]|uniref:Uncharacterized protein n=1 Tax=Trachymyrmex cornetzi TaxID=471704 RepID=A0A151JR22_9HYME|nr:hypothetical protein ALC57_00697 [Trachymyrmex cornetzi]
MEKIKNVPIGNLPSAVILIKATSAGVPTNAPTQPAAIPSTAFTMKLGCVSFLNQANILDINLLQFLYNCKILYTKLTYEETSISQVYIPSLVVVYVACRIKPADKPEYNAKTPSFFRIDDVTLNVDVFVPLNCMRFFIKSNGCTKHVAAIL